MIDKAIKKLTEEMMKLDEPFSRAIEEHLTEICTNNDVAEKILQEGKTLKGACESVKNIARKNQKNGVGCVSDSEAYRIVEEYFNISVIKKIDVLDLL